MRGCIYARESLDDQTRAPPIQNQIDLGLKVIKDRGHECLHTYADDGYSGADWKRPDWNNLKEDVKSGMYDFVWVFNQDRIARDLEAFTNFYRVVHDECKTRIFTGQDFHELEMETLGGMAAESGQAFAHAIFRKTISAKMKGLYAHKKKIAEENNTPVRWGRLPVPNSMIEEVRKIRDAHPEFGCRLIARELPPYYLKIRQGETEPRAKRVSHTWVAWALKQLPDVKKED